MNPAAQPAAKAATVAINGLTPCVIKVTATAPPKGNEPSAVISGKFRIRKVKKIPKPKIAHNRPWLIVETIIFSLPLLL